jgi:hypothetical protein
MSETLEKTMTVTQARQLLRDTSRLPSERVDEANRTIARWYASRPPAHQRCVACGATGRWSEHEAPDGNPAWACSICHAAASLTADQWRAKRAEQDTAQQAATAAAAAAAQPKPRARLAEALAARAEANAAIVKLERALPAARSAATEAQERHDRAVEAAETSNADSAEHLAASFFSGTRPPDAARAAAAARGELAAAVDALIVAKNARTILDGKVKDARTAMGYANDRCRKAAYGVLVAERLEELLAGVSEARAAYLECAGQLGWLIKTHVIPDSDRRAHQFLGEANTPPSTWREAATAGTTTMEDALAALLADAGAAVI